MERETGRFGPEQRIQLDVSSHPKPYFIHLSGSGSFEPSGCDRLRVHPEGTIVDPEEKSKMKIDSERTFPTLDFMVALPVIYSEEIDLT
jgi:hypothetical protein